MGVQLHVAELGGPISQFLEPLQAAWASAVPLERDLADERVRRKEHEQVLAEVLTKFQRDFAADLVRRFGVPADGLPGMTIPNEVVEAFPSQVETSAPVRDLYPFMPRGAATYPASAWFEAQPERLASVAHGKLRREPAD
jgi:hypothetical protein